MNGTGNIREIKNCMEFMVNSAEENIVSLSNLPKWLKKGKAHFSAFGKLEAVKNDRFCDAKSHFESNFIRKVLLKNNGKINQTAREMGISKTTLIAKVRKYDIKSQINEF